MPQPVKLYTLSTCGHCTAAKRFLDACAVRYEFTDIDLLSENERKAVLEDVKKVSPQFMFPAIIIGDKVVIGFRENEIREALSANGY